MTLSVLSYELARAGAAAFHPLPRLLHQPHHMAPCSETHKPNQQTQTYSIRHITHNNKKTIINKAP